MVLIGLGIGPSLPLYTLIAQGAARPEAVGVVSALSTFSRAIGQVLGVTIAGRSSRSGSRAVVPPGAADPIAAAPPDTLTGAVAFLYRVRDSGHRLIGLVRRCCCRTASEGGEA